MIRQSKEIWFEVWGTEVAQNRFLKFLVVTLAALVTVFATSLIFLAMKAPIVFAVSSVESGVLRQEVPPRAYLENEARRVITEYLQRRHSWESTDVQSSISKASKYVDDTFRKAFLQANETQVKIAVEKKISQKFFVSSSSLDLDSKKAIVSGERILNIDGLRAVSSLSFELRFRLGERTEANPEGVYIVAEQLLEASREVK